MKELEENIGYVFKDKRLLQQALTHSSYANEHGIARAACNERLEFLGDSILGFVVAEYLYEKFPDKPEGEMTKIRAELVCENSLAAAAVKLELGKHLLLGKGEKNSGGDKRPSIISDAFEAVLAAIYLDGGEKAARQHIQRFVLGGANKKSAAENKDYKTMLQELIQRGGTDTPVYRVCGESGPDHNKSFEAEVLCGGKVMGRGTGKSKKEAEQAAAAAAMSALGENGVE